MKAKIGDVVAVEWEDAWFDQDEVSPIDWKDVMEMTTYGELRRLDPVVTVAGEPIAGGRDRATTHIPKAVVKRIRVLERREK